MSHLKTLTAMLTETGIPFEEQPATFRDPLDRGWAAREVTIDRNACLVHFYFDEDGRLLEIAPWCEE